MGKKATTISEQIDILKERGMNFDCGIEKAEEMLLDIGYYRLGFYWYPFEIDKEHNFKEGTTFSNVISLYYLDVDLRNVLLKYLKRIEVNFRTKIIYYTSHKYIEDPIWYSNPKIMAYWFISKLDVNLYTDKFKEENKQIKLHHINYRNDIYAPTWKTFEFLTFGAIVTIFNALKSEELKKEISKLYGLNNLNTFINFIHTIKFIRNICAHAGVLYDLNFPQGIYKIPRVKFNNNNNQSLDAGIKTMSFILKNISEGRNSDMNTEINDLLKEHTNNETLKGIITNKIGYDI
ncbi:abortive infection bacteriophage resistance protein, abi_2 superfamily [Psychroflexus torquis ATCC 700755]|uniref:Abortive infection bacteriophage resistance protein, abi_2 superfamily n=1 Tax=Psychroflexus torquis (strain ATCC 700755 / CIP 106069 / ACAM 623) TaxID=313595 RepID=K4IJC2_PSYTT|nr:Abi family protein [Psychroflexus torquis]AFU69918.1 abortive infection bacteriophage resistance protein, abi_2 superfamily [Psychroflexus torquis ATCC 700755]